MTILSYKTITNLENSLYDFVNEAVSTASLQVVKDGETTDVSVEVGYKINRDWTLPIIQLYHDSKTLPRLELGSNKRLKQHLMILDIRADSGFNRDNLADWLEETINDGFPYYEYTPNGSNPTKTQNGRVSFEFVSSTKVDLGDDVDIFDKYRYRITINCYITCN